jgi:hypothetical protein
MKYLLNLLLLIAMTTGYAQQKTDINGTYTINKSKIDFGKAPEWVLPSRFKVVKEGDKLTITRTLVNEAGTETDRTYGFSGVAPYEYTVNDQKNTVTLVWAADKSGFTLHLQSITAEGKPGQSYTEVWSLSNGGKTLIIDRNVEQANGVKYTIKGYYEKQ